MDQKQKDLKKAWKATNRDAARASFPLPNAELAKLFQFVDECLNKVPCDHSRKITETWLREKGHDVARVTAWLTEHGGYCDCEVVANAQEFWAENGGEVDV